MYGKLKDFLTQELANIKAAGLYKNERIITTPQRADIKVNAGSDVLNFCANNYLGLSDNQRLIKAAKEAMDTHGYGMSSVRFICGTQDLHKQLEAAISDYFKTEDTILYAACFDANGGLFEPLFTEEDAIISDALNHASIIDGVRLCKAKRYRYANADMADLERCLQEAQAQRHRIIATDGVFSMDGNNGMGSTIGTAAMQACIRRAKEYGVRFCTVNHASHYGFGGFYAMQAAAEGMIGFNICNSPALVAPFGGATAMLGTNPLTVAVPSGKYPDLVLDMATSTVAKGKIALALKEGKSIPDNWALAPDGSPTTDPAVANKGALTPLGGAKGYALALIIDVICCCLCGGNNSRQIPRMFEDPKEPSGVGYFMGAIDIGRFVDLETFKARTDAMYDELKAAPTAPGFREIMIPGEIEFHLTRQAEREGIDISPAIEQDFADLAARYGVPLELLQSC